MTRAAALWRQAVRPALGNRWVERFGPDKGQLAAVMPRCFALPVSVPFGMARLRGLLVSLVAVAALGDCGTPARSIVVEQAGGNLTSGKTTPTSARSAIPILPTSTIQADGLSSAMAAQIASEIATLFGYGPSLDRKLAIVADGASLRSVVAQGMADPRAPALTLRVTGVVMQSPGLVVATIDFLLDGRPAMNGATLEFTLIDGRWMAARSSYCALLATGGLHCPTPAVPTVGGPLKGVVPYSPNLAITVGPAAGPPGTTVQIKVRGCNDPTGQNHAVSFNNDAQNTGARNNPNTLASIADTQTGTDLRATYTIRAVDRT